MQFANNSNNDNKTWFYKAIQIDELQYEATGKVAHEYKNKKNLTISATTGKR